MESQQGSGARTDRAVRVELRVHKRVACKLPVNCRGNSKEIVGSAENIGAGGLLVRADQTFPWDEVVRLSFSLPGLAAPLELDARVAHVVPDLFMGLEFLNLPAILREKIEEFVFTASAPPPRRS